MLSKKTETGIRSIIKVSREIQNNKTHQHHFDNFDYFAVIDILEVLLSEIERLRWEQNNTILKSYNADHEN